MGKTCAMAADSLALTKPNRIKSDPQKSRSLKQCKFNSLMWCLIGKHFWQSTWRSFMFRRNWQWPEHCPIILLLFATIYWIYSLNRFKFYMKEKIRVYNFSTLEKITNYPPPSAATYTNEWNGRWLLERERK